MQVKEIYSLINSIQAEIMGDAYNDPENAAYIIQEDLSNIATVGTKLLDSTSLTAAGTTWRDNFVKSMIDRIGRMVFVDRVYKSIFPDLRRDEWEYGSIMTKSRCKRFEAKNNPSWALTAGQTVNQFEFTPPEVMTLFYNDKTAWQIDCTLENAEVNPDEQFYDRPDRRRGSRPRGGPSDYFRNLARNVQTDLRPCFRLAFHRPCHCFGRYGHKLRR